AKPAAQETFGAYTLLDRVALGGMAEVWKARMKGVEGFQKTVAIKKILPHLTDSVDFVTMFIDEAKLAAQLNPPNIIHIYDLGKLGEDYYIAMEYVEGKDLRSILNTARKREQALPAGLALLVAARLASATSTTASSVSCTATCRRRTCWSATTATSSSATSASSRRWRRRARRRW